MIDVGIVGIRNYPAEYGAYDTLTVQLVDRNLGDFRFNLSVLRERKVSNDSKLVIFEVPSFLRNRVIGGNLYNICRMYCSGVKNFLFLGYGLSFLFPFLKLLGCRIICNTDGFEYRRQKWGQVSKLYFRSCEWILGVSAVEYVFDSKLIQRYFSRKYGVAGYLIFYGADHFAVENEGIQDWFIVVMRLEPENNIKMIVDAFCISGEKLLIVGVATDYFWREVYPLIGNSQNIKYAGPIFDREKLFSLRSEAKGYVHGHSVGGVNPTLVEAVMVGRPVISFDTFFNREVLGQGASYFDSTEGLAEILMGGHWSDIAPSSLPIEFDWDYVVGRYFDIFRG